ncbi:MAG: PP2C family protein-serine/threonine phosphatase [Candidatus Methylumidiphilus sp.]
MDNTIINATPTDGAPPPAAAPAQKRRRGGLEAAYASATGLHHVINEDCCAHWPSADAPVFCAVADGVGGGAHGNVASQALVAHCAQAGREVYADRQRLADWLRQGDAVVREAIARRGNRPGASTLVAAWFLSESCAHVTNIGDCRAYRLSRKLWGGWRIEQITLDQTYANLDRSPPPGGSPDDPACMAGVGAVGPTKVLPVRLAAGELLLLCSDGLHKFVDDQSLASLCGEELGKGAGLAAVCQVLVATAKAQGSHDDVSALLVLRRRWFGAGLGYWLALLAGLLLAVAGKATAPQIQGVIADRLG